MREYLRGIMLECEYPNNAAEYLLSSFDKLMAKCSDELTGLISAYEKSYNIDYTAAMEKMREISVLAEVNCYTGDLLLFLCYTRALRRYYRQEGISDSIFLDTILDLRYKLDECKCVYGVYGSFVAKWFVGFFKLERFALGRLQFEIVTLGNDYDLNGVALKADTKALNVHIPRTGTRLDHSDVLESYRLARDFYSDRLGDEIIFACSSWLLFPRHREMLSETSNILRFMSDYTIVASGEYGDYSEAWRLFDVMYDGNVEGLPADSSLRRAYVDLIKRGEPTGWGKGIFAFK